jgi:hypothetical protein
MTIRIGFDGQVWAAEVWRVAAPDRAISAKPNTENPQRRMYFSSDRQ